MPCSPPGDLPNPGIKPRSLTLWADSLLSEPPEKPSKVSNHVLFGEFMEDYSLGDSLSDRAEGLYKRVDGRAMIYSGFTGKKKKKKSNIKRIGLKTKAKHLKLMILVLFFLWEDVKVWAY